MKKLKIKYTFYITVAGIGLLFTLGGGLLSYLYNEYPFGGLLAVLGIPIFTLTVVLMMFSVNDDFGGEE